MFELETVFHSVVKGRLLPFSIYLHPHTKTSLVTPHMQNIKSIASCYPLVPPPHTMIDLGASKLKQTTDKHHAHVRS